MNAISRRLRQGGLVNQRITLLLLVVFALAAPILVGSLLGP